MYILKYYYFKHDENFNPIGNPIYKECAGMKLSKVMDAYRSGIENHDLSKYTKRTIYDIINTDEQ